jgi:hypothetical protein
MMTRKQFKQAIKLIKKLHKQNFKLHKVGFDLDEGKYPITSTAYKIIDLMFVSHYDTIKSDHINWFIYETDCGKTNNTVEINGKQYTVATINDFYTLFLID